jgi:hypothetical protein
MDDEKITEISPEESRNGSNSKGFSDGDEPEEFGRSQEGADGKPLCHEIEEKKPQNFHGTDANSPNKESIAGVPETPALVLPEGDHSARGGLRPMWANRGRNTREEGNLI